jgi:excinuclease ABC subunit C
MICFTIFNFQTRDNVFLLPLIFIIFFILVCLFFKGGIHIFLKEKVKGLPITPGVYLMKDLTGNIIYVGKAKNLKRRVQSYFQHSKAHSQKVLKMVHNIEDFDYILTDTEFEAFLLECQLIKELKPHFNKKMKSPQRYSYIEIDRRNEYPSIKVVSIPNIQNQYFGPFLNKHTMEKALQGLKEYFKIQCVNPAKKSACLNVSLGLCIGICTGSAKEQYQAIINRIIALLNGTDLSILEEMRQKMMDASVDFDFEMASKYRDYIEVVAHLINKEKVIEFTKKNHNIVVMDLDRKLFLIKGNKVIFNEKYDFDMEGFKSKLLTYFKIDGDDSFNKVSKENLDEAQIIYSYLKSSNCKYVIILDEWLEAKNMAKLDKELTKLFS